MFPSGSMDIGVQTYHCPSHGAVTEVIHSTIVGHEGRWCAKCWLEMVDKACHRVTDGPAPKPPKKADW